jgi:hypothetical protein
MTPSITGPEHDFLVIIDSMCNLDLLYLAAAHTGATDLANAATTHADTVLAMHLRPETTMHQAGYIGTLCSTFHVANFDPATGKLKDRCTVQGCERRSTLARGQAWAILGFAQTYGWTGERRFLDAARGAAEYFLLRLETAPATAPATAKSGQFVPVWDFDAPAEPEATAVGPLEGRVGGGRGCEWNVGDCAGGGGDGRRQI